MSVTARLAPDLTAAGLVVCPLAFIKGRFGQVA